MALTMYVMKGLPALAFASELGATNTEEQANALGVFHTNCMPACPFSLRPRTNVRMHTELHERACVRMVYHPPACVLSHARSLKCRRL
jgi:hypothetical protein